jgi:hypothetical protein
LLSSVSRLFTTFGSLDVSQPHGPLRPATAIGLLKVFTAVKVNIVAFQTITQRSLVAGSGDGGFFIPSTQGEVA